jgi:hypothetical protein
MRIGITVDTSRNTWSSETAQSAFFLYDILRRSGAECYYISNGRLAPQGFKGHKYIDLTKLLEEGGPQFDIILMGESPLTYPQLNTLKKRNAKCKIIFLSFHNKLADDAQQCLFSDSVPVGTYSGVPDLHFLFDEIWISSHHDYQRPYIQTLFQNENIKPVPYIWDPAPIQHAIKNTDPQKLFFNPSHPHQKETSKNICIFEPNSSFSQNFLVPLIICEKAYVSHKLDIDAINIFNCKKLRSNKGLSSVLSKLHLTKDKKTYFNNRWGFIDAIERWGGAVVSHQTTNELTRLHLECLYLGVPLIHNCKSLEDAGYFYENSDINEGADQLRLALVRHAELFDYYKGRAKEYIAKYSIYNTHNVNAYGKLIS